MNIARSAIVSAFAAGCFVLSAGLLQAAPELTIMARTGSQGLTAIDPNIAINHQGKIAFTGRDSSRSRVFVVSSPG